LNELSDLLGKLRQTAGFPSGDGVEAVPQPDGQPSAASDTNHQELTAEADFLLESISSWAGGDGQRWDRVLVELKRSWRPTGWEPETPRDLLVAWSAANFRLFAAQSALLKQDELHHLTRGQRVARMAREADVSSYSRLASGLKSWAAEALQQDAEAVRILQRLCSHSEES
jgi:hypothetical protein